VLPVVIGSAMVVLGLIALAIIGVTAFLTARFGPLAPDQPLIAGSAGPPVAAAPLECPGACFNNSSVAGTIAPYDAFAALDVLDNTYPWGTYDPTTAGELFRGAVPGWTNSEGTPDECFFAPGNSPLAASLDTGDPKSEDPIHFLGTTENSDRTTSIDQSARVFVDSASAETYMTEEANQIAHCDLITIGTSGEVYSAEITPEPAIDVPESVAAIGWVRTGDPGPRWRAYVIDVQYGNLIVRNRMLTDGTNTEAEFRTFVESVAAQLPQLEPIAP